VKGGKLSSENELEVPDSEGDDSSTDISDATGSGAVTPRDSDSDVKGGRVPAVKAGGMRRKVVRRR
jgi:hypothetical protein